MEYKLKEEIINRSESDSWNLARNEWVFEYAYQSNEKETCLCGHYPILNICVIKNHKNNRQTDVGNCCISKFLGIKDGDKIFPSLKRLKGDIDKSMSQEVLDYLNTKRILDEFEYKFYTDIIKKRKLSEKQLLIKRSINHKLLAFTSSDSNSHLSKINMILEWAEDHKSFDTTFIISLKTTIEKKGALSEKQNNSMNNIIKKFNI